MDGADAAEAGAVNGAASSHDQLGPQQAQDIEIAEEQTQTDAEEPTAEEQTQTDAEEQTRTDAAEQTRTNRALAEEQALATATAEDREAKQRWRILIRVFGLGLVSSLPSSPSRCSWQPSGAGKPC